MGSTVVSDSASEATRDFNNRSWRQRLRLPLLLLGIVVVAIGSLYFWLTGGRYMSTDDAYVQVALVSISSNVSGRVVAVAVHDNERVKRGDLLFQLDPQPYRIAVASARAERDTARLKIVADKASYRQQLAALQASQDTLAYQQKEYQRRQKLAASGVVSQAQFDQAKHTLDEARQQAAAVQHQVASALAILGDNPDIEPSQHPAMQQAQAKLDRAELNLAYARITAPSDGIVTKVEQLQAGDYIEAAQPVFALISTRAPWVEANFKESQLTHMRIGQSATVAIDSYPGQTFHVRVASIAPGTGAQFAVLPAENATGNWVKVVQRLPVRLEFVRDQSAQDSPNLALQSGLSATVEVDTGYRRSLFGAHRE